MQIWLWVLPGLLLRCTRLRVCYALCICAAEASTLLRPLYFPVVLPPGFLHKERWMHRIALPIPCLGVFLGNIPGSICPFVLEPHRGDSPYQKPHLVPEAYDPTPQAPTWGERKEPWLGKRQASPEHLAQTCIRKRSHDWFQKSHILKTKDRGGKDDTGNNITEGWMLMCF